MSQAGDSLTTESVALRNVPEQDTDRGFVRYGREWTSRDAGRRRVEQDANISSRDK
jgi:hypothetical protein